MWDKLKWGNKKEEVVHPQPKTTQKTKKPRKPRVSCVSFMSLIDGNNVLYKGIVINKKKTKKSNIYIISVIYKGKTKLTSPTIRYIDVSLCSTIDTLPMGSSPMYDIKYLSQVYS